MKKPTAKVSRRGLLRAGAGLALTGVLPETASGQAATQRPSVYE